MPRRRLEGRLAGADALAVPTVVTLVAPAGYGKSALMRALMGDAAAGPMVRISVGECEHHPALFLDLLATAVRVRFPAADLRPLLQLKGETPLEELGVRLPYVLSRVLESQFDGAVTVLLDDLQGLQRGEPLTDVIAGLLRAEPRRIRYVLASRRRLPIDLAPHRQRGDLLELTGGDLAFTEEETAELLELSLGRKPPESVVTRLWDRTRGWPGVVRLVCTLVRGRGDEELSAFVDDLSGQEDAIVDFVVESLLDGYSSPVRYFMKVISVLGRVERSVVRALFGADGQSAVSRQVIALPDGRILEYLQRLEDTQVLQPAARGDGSLEFNPLVSGSLQKLLKHEDERLYREAHRRVAEWYLRKDGDIDSASLDHLVAAEDFDRALTLLESEAERFYSGGYHRQLSRWLWQLERHYATLPFWACYYLGRIYAARGEWDRARSYLDRCKANLPSREVAGDLWRWQPKVCLGYAAMYWRRGMHAEASTYCRRGKDYLRQLRRRSLIPEGHRAEAARIELKLSNLLGQVKMETGVYDRAWTVCEEARELARAEGLAREEAAALRNLGLIATRRGAVKEAIRYLEAALQRADPAEDAELHAMIAYQLGAAHLLDGRVEVARGLVQGALDQLIDSGRPATIVHVLATLARVHDAAGNADEADKAFRRAIRLLDSVGDVKVRAEVLDRYVIFLATHKRLHEARVMLDRASALVDGLLRSEVHLVALHSEALGERDAARGALDRAIQRVQQAVDRYTRIGARFDVARLSWRMAHWHHLQFVAGAAETPEAVLEALAVACHAAEEHGYVFRAPLAETELLHVGIAYGEEEVQRHCGLAMERSLGEVPADAGARMLTEEAAARYRDYRRRAELADDYVIATRDGRRGANARQIDELVGDRGEEALVLLAHEQVMVNRGAEVSLAEKRVILPLLLHFLREPNDVFTMDELARRVWKSRDGKHAMQTKVKVAISRLRALLGKDRAVVITTRVEKPSGSGTSVAYGLAPDLEFYVVERIEDEEL